MAEKYGTIPKRFTKEWWSWYWMYHKGITLGVIFAVLVIGYTTYSSVTAEKYDVTLTYAGSYVYPDSYQEKAEKLLSPLCEDLDDNGKKSLFFSQLVIDYESKDVEFLQANTLKFDMAIGEESTYLFIVEKNIADKYIGENKKDACFAPLKDWVTEDISNLSTYDAHGESYGVAISDIKLFQEAGMDQEELYLFMRYNPRKDQLKEHKKGYNASIKLANKILEYGIE